ncbi:hypothetical protein ESU54_17630 [Aequorivita antarctica]|uniref:Uncharacterized protein n=2 Tax=Aequorivita antarctica TaxID=153266 RepID=A0A5C6YVK7_9FLAO|nr:hypothetical protein ESU54_17630 [Aequorivita antarctica]
MALYNIGLGSVFSGVGALINKKPNERWGKVLLKGMGQGALGGYLIYESKNLIANINNKQKWEYSWYGKIVNSAGTSIVENASSNRDFWEKWHLNIGFNRLEFYTKDKFQVKYKIMPISLYLAVSTAISNKFEFKRTLQTGEIIFSNNNTGNSGTTYGNIVLIERDLLGNYNVFTHEIIHIYQYYDYNFINTYLNKPYKKWSEQSKTFSKINDLFYIDLNGVILRPLYLLENGNKNCYYDNFFENEAGFYTGFRSCD